MTRRTTNLLSSTAIEKGAIAMRDHFQFNSPRLEGLGAKLPQHSGQRRPKPPPQFFFQIAQVRDPARTPDTGIDFGMFAITDTRWDKTFAPLLHKSKSRRAISGPSQLAIRPCGGGFRKTAWFIGIESNIARAAPCIRRSNRVGDHKLHDLIEAPRRERAQHATLRGRFRRRSDAGTTFRQRR